jgi:serine/threonine protein kinase
VKAFSKAYVKSQDRGRDSLINEIQILQGLHHPNIMEAIEIHESSNSLYLVMELLEGGEICSFQKGKLDQESTSHILRSILKALVHLDIKGIMHRDLKPDNIIFKKKDCSASENTVKLVDFGLASRCDVDNYLFRRCGTPGFIAPEVINSKKDDTTMFSTKCDIFSAGVIFYFMLTGKIPYEGKNF